MDFATRVHRRCLRTRGWSGSPWNILRRLLIRFFNDPASTMLIHGVELRMPLSHSLPEYLRDLPLYDSAIGRVADYIRGRHGHLCAIDVGANVGDTIAAMSLRENDKCLALEPNAKFFACLKENWGSARQITCMNVFCSDRARISGIVMEECRGTAGVVSQGKGERGMGSVRLDDLLEGVPDFLHANFLKVDTDGHDAEVLGGSGSLLSRERPTVMFEWDVPKEGGDALQRIRELLRFLKECGYATSVVYDNAGYLVGTVPLEAEATWTDMCMYQSARPYYYYDVVVMGTDCLCEFAAKEKAFRLKR